MGKITIDEMHNSLFDYAQAVSDENLMTENKTIVGAINEIYGKRLIADSIGEPLNNTDTFTKMSDDINNLLSTFKTNIMNAGIAVESGDKFKTLIDKIKGLTEGEENKSIQFAQGNGKQISVSTLMNEGISVDIDFEPTFLFLAISNRNTPSYTTSSYHGGIGTLGVIAICMPDLVETDSSRTIGLGAVGNGNSSSFYYDIVFNTGLTDGKITIEKKRVGASWIYGDPAIDYDWLAIRTGEEDTTLRDLLASILQDKGVEVTEEDTMASLISKVATLDDDEGLQYAEGTLTAFLQNYNTGDSITFNIDCDFVPTALFLKVASVSGSSDSQIQNIFVSNLSPFTINPDPRIFNGNSPTYLIEAEITNLTNNSFDIHIINGGACKSVIQFTNYYAIGVGEEDTTLSGGLDVISSTELPATGKDNQICVVTNNPVNNFVLTTSDSDITTNTSPIYGKLGYGTSDISGTVTIGEGIQTIYRVDGFFQSGKRQNSYIYQNSQWNQFTKTGISIIRDKAYCTDTQLYGEFPTSTYNDNVTFKMQEGYGLYIYNNASGYTYYSFIPTAIDISAFNRIVLKWEITSYGNSESQYLYIFGSSTNPGNGRIGQSYTNYTEFAWTNNVYNNSNVGTLTADISGMTGTYYIGIGHYYANTGGLYVYDFYLE